MKCFGQNVLLNHIGRFVSIMAVFDIHKIVFWVLNDWLNYQMSFFYHRLVAVERSCCEQPMKKLQYSL